ncbi:hypothetical protein BRADI_1g13180v3 [Brachypodium distachyon]|uniref:CCHC-type domain-containing protein n=1 Tax=Brachypodium distachyon TaxID=15368 RepID=A0A2K2DJ92_BRADI|nr:hypothetical protein BRADI_1g13180v3 [Brachypodium distachyon]
MIDFFRFLCLFLSAEYADENAMVPQNVTVLVRRTAGQMSENIVLFSSRIVIEDGSVASNKSVITESASKSCSSTEVQDEDAAIAAVIYAAELKWEEQSSKRGQGGGRFTSGRHYGHGPLEGEAPPPGYVCRSCGVPGHFIQHCPQENQKPPPGYTCFRCRIPGHFIQHCPTIGDLKFDNYNKVSRSLAPVVSANPVDGIPSALAPAASVSVVDDLPAELHCRLCNKVMADAVLTSKCCFDSFCDKCIRDYIITQSKCICGVKVLADDLIPNHTLRSTISNLLATRTSSTTSGTGKHRSSSGSNPDPKSQSHITSTALERDMKQCTDNQLSSASPDGGVQVATEDNKVSWAQENLDQKSKAEDSARCSVQKAVPSANALKLKDVSESTLKNSTISGALEAKVARTDQLKKKRKKADSTKIVHSNNANYGYNVPFDPAYSNSGYNVPFDPAYSNAFNSGYPWVTEPYMYGAMGMAYGGYPMGPFGANPFGNIPPQALAMQGYPASYQNWENHSALQREAETSARSRQIGMSKDSAPQPRPSEHSHRLASPLRRESRNRSPLNAESRSRSPHRRESRNRSRSRPERDHGRYDRDSNDYDEDHQSRKRIRLSSPMDDDKQSKRRSRHSSSDDEQNFKRQWGRRSSVIMATRS